MYEIMDECGDMSFVDLLWIGVDRPAEVGVVFVFGTSYVFFVDLDSDGVDFK